MGIASCFGIILYSRQIIKEPSQIKRLFPIYFAFFGTISLSIYKNILFSDRSVVFGVNIFLSFSIILSLFIINLATFILMFKYLTYNSNFDESDETNLKQNRKVAQALFTFNIIALILMLSSTFSKQAHSKLLLFRLGLGINGFYCVVIGYQLRTQINQFLEKLKALAIINKNNRNKLCKMYKIVLFGHLFLLFLVFSTSFPALFSFTALRLWIWWGPLIILTGILLSIVLNFVFDNIRKSSNIAFQSASTQS